MEIIGRKTELNKLHKILSSKQAEFVAVYGRRRVGKTYLIREYFKDRPCIFFRTSGINKGSLKLQLNKFKNEIENTFYSPHSETRLATLHNWHEAFQALTAAINLFGGKKKVILFLDELPWMATPKSGLLEALDYFWNRYWSEDNRIKLFICGSAASWIIDNILHNTGGLHNRVTLKMRIEPFSLAETKNYLAYKNCRFTNEQILTLYMCLGGIPYYLNHVENGLSAIQNIDESCFRKSGGLYDEFDVLFSSLFKADQRHRDIVTFIASKREGISRSDIETHFQLKGGRLTARLKELEEAGFIIPFMPAKKERGLYYKLIDEYCLFYLSWIEQRKRSRIAKHLDDNYWEVISTKPAWKAWSGYSFELICFKHINQIIKALRIPAGSEISSWRYFADKTNSESGFQLDLIIDRPDNAINLCEIKYCSTPFVLDKKYATHLLSREKIYCAVTKTKKQIFHSLIVSAGLKPSIYSDELIASSASLDDLFNE